MLDDGAAGEADPDADGSEVLLADVVDVVVADHVAADEDGRVGGVRVGGLLRLFAGGFADLDAVGSGVGDFVPFNDVVLAAAAEADGSGSVADDAAVVDTAADGVGEFDGRRGQLPVVTGAGVEGGLEPGVTFVGQREGGVLEAQAGEAEVAGAVDAHELGGDGDDGAGFGEILAAHGEVGDEAGRAVAVPLAGAVQQFERVFEVVALVGVRRR